MRICMPLFVVYTESVPVPDKYFLSEVCSVYFTVFIFKITICFFLKLHTTFMPYKNWRYKFKQLQETSLLFNVIREVKHDLLVGLHALIILS